MEGYSVDDMFFKKQQMQVFTKEGWEYTNRNIIFFLVRSFIVMLTLILTLIIPGQEGHSHFGVVIMKSIIIIVAFLFFLMDSFIFIRDRVLRIMKIQGESIRVFKHNSLSGIRWINLHTINRIEYVVEFLDVEETDLSVTQGTFDSATKYIRGYNKNLEILFNIKDFQLSGAEIKLIIDKCEKYGITFETIPKRRLCSLIDILPFHI